MVKNRSEKIVFRGVGRVRDDGVGGVRVIG